MSESPSEINVRGVVGRAQDAAARAVEDGRWAAVAEAAGLDKFIATIVPLFNEWHRTVTSEQLARAFTMLGLRAADADAAVALFNAHRPCSCAESKVNASSSSKGPLS